MAEAMNVKNVNGAVRITLPVSVANDLGKLQEGLGVIAAQMGCPQCCSGVDLSFQLEREAILNEKLELESSLLRRSSIGAGTVELKGLAQTDRPVSVVIPAKVSYDIGSLQESLARVVDRLGCQACCSGFDITFIHEREFLLDQDLNIHAIARR
jgi:hypothetical protein